MSVFRRNEKRIVQHLSNRAGRAWVGRQVRALVRRNWPAILRLAAALQERGALTAAEIDDLTR